MERLKGIVMETNCGENPVIIIKYNSTSENEITERQISGALSKFSNGNFLISAYCHLREDVRSFNLENIIELKIDNEVANKYEFYYDNLKSKKRFMSGIEGVIIGKIMTLKSKVQFIKEVCNGFNVELDIDKLMNDGLNND
jgi:predicted DNA-binding transcriptional regulator YafY